MESYNNNEKGHVDEKLPPRSVYHAQNNKKEKNNYRLKMPIIRLISLILVIGVISIISIKLFTGEDEKAVTAEPKQEEKDPIEKIGEAVDEKVNEVKPPVVVDTKEEEEKKEEASPISPPAVSQKPVNSKPETPNATEPTESNTKPVDNTTKPVDSTKKPVEETKVEYFEHKVAANETLYRIAINYFKSSAGIEIIQKHNGLKDTNIKEGQILKIPKQ